MTDGGQPPNQNREQPTELGQPPDRPIQAPSEQPPPKANLRPAVPMQAQPDDTHIYRPDELDEIADRLGAASTRDYEPQDPVERDPFSDTQVQPLSWDAGANQSPPTPPASPPASPPLGQFDDALTGHTTQIGGPPETPAPLRGPVPGPSPKPPPGPPSQPTPVVDAAASAPRFQPPTPPQESTPGGIAPDSGALTPGLFADYSHPASPNTPQPSPTPIPPPAMPTASEPTQAAVPMPPPQMPAPQPPEPAPTPMPPPQMPAPQPPQPAAPLPPRPMLAPQGQANDSASNPSSSIGGEIGNQPMAVGQTAMSDRAGMFNAASLSDDSLLLPMIALASSLVAMALVGIANYFEFFSRAGSTAFWRDLTGFWPALLVASTVALAIVTTDISERARNAFIAAAALTIIPSGISYLQLVWNVLFGNAQFRSLFQTLVGPTGQTVALAALAAGAAFFASSDRDKAQKILSLGLVAVPALSVLSTPRLWGSMPPFGFMDQIAALLAGFTAAMGAGLLVAAIANILRPIDKPLRLLIAGVAAGTIGFTVVQELASSIGDGQARFFNFGNGDGRITITLCALALILSLLNGPHSTPERGTPEHITPEHS